MYDDDYDDLDSFNDGYKPESAIAQGLDVLADGEYDFEIKSCELTRTPNSGNRLFRMHLLVSGKKIEHPYFLGKQSQVNQLGADLCALGIDADRWGTAERPLSKELPAACPLLTGVRFRGKKETSKSKDDPEKKFHNLRIRSRIAGAPMPVAVDGNGGENDNEIPF